jgi:hypothetical protein
MWIYRWLVRLYPASYRRLFGEQMLQTFHDHYRDAVVSGEESAARFWLGVIADEAKAIPHACLTAAQDVWRQRSVSLSAAQQGSRDNMRAPHEPQLQLTFKQVLFFARLLAVVAIVALGGDVLVGVMTPSYQGFAFSPTAGVSPALALAHLFVRAAAWTLPVMAFTALVVAYTPRRSRAHFWAIVLVGGVALLGVTFIWVLSDLVLPDLHSPYITDLRGILTVVMLYYGPYLFFDGVLLLLSLERWDWPQRTRTIAQLA